jgi:hypothetical protein
MRFSPGDVRGHIVFQKDDHGAWYWHYRVLQRQSGLRISFCEIFSVARFSTFATKSAISGLTLCKLAANDPAFIKLGSIRIWLRANGSAPYVAAGFFFFGFDLAVLGCSTGSDPRSIEVRRPAVKV